MPEPPHRQAPSVGSLDDTAIMARVDSLAAAPELARALVTLSAGDREVLLLTAWADLSYAEAATSMTQTPAPP